MTMGIYALYWQEQDLIYIGQSQNIEARYKEHLYKMKNNNHTNYKVQNAFNLYGQPLLQIIEECNIEMCNELEIYYTEQFDSINNGLNIVEAGSVGWGVNSSASKYTKRQILKVFSLLYKTKYTYQEISTRTKVRVSTILDIRTNKSHHWLKETYPTKFSQMTSLRASLSPVRTTLETKAGKAYLVADPNGVVHSVSNIREFCRQHPLLKDNEASNNVQLGRLLNGSRSTFGTWKKL